MRRSWMLVVGAALVGAVLVYLFFFARRGEHTPARSGPAAVAPVPTGAAPSKPPPSAAVAGRVTDAGGVAVSGAVVRLAPHADGPDAPATAVARTGADGSYRLADLSPGRWRASAAAPGYLPAHVGSVELKAGEEASVPFVLEAGGRAVTGTITDRTGGPIAGALVEVAPLHGLLSTRDERVSAALTDVAGRYTVPAAEGRHRVAASHPEYVGEARAADVGPAGAVVDFTLLPGGVIEGIVREHRTGTPVAGAQVIHVREAMAGLPFGERISVNGRRGMTVADAEGRFRITGLEPGTIRLSARAAGLATREPTVVPLGVAGQLSGVAVFVGGAFAIRGTVSLEGGGPVAGAEIEAFARSDEARAVTDATGRFAVDGLPPGDYGLIARSPDTLPAGRPLRVAVRDRDVTDVSIVLRRGAFVSGRVEPPGMAEVAVKADRGLPGVFGDGPMVLTRGASTLTAPDGTFTLGPVAPGSLTLQGRAADGRQGETEVAVAVDGARGVIIRLEERARLSGRVVDESGRGLPGRMVHTRRVDGEENVTMIVNGLDVSAVRAPTAADGKFEVLGLSAGTYELTAHDEAGDRLALAKGAAPPRVTLRDNERRAGIEVVVEAKDGVIRGTVLGPDGQPLPDAWVTASAVLERPPPGEGGTRTNTAVIVTEDGEGMSGGIPPALTDANGRFEIVGLRRGSYRLLGEGLSGTARGLLEGVATGSEVQLRLVRLTTLEGKVSAGGKPVGEFTVELSGVARRTETFHDANGTFTMSRVDPGPYQVTVTAPEGSGKADVVVVADTKNPVAVALVGNAKVIGKVLAADGTPVAGAPVVAAVVQQGGMIRLAIEGEPPTTGKDGSFVIDVAPGKHMLIVLGKAGPLVRKPIEVVSGQALDLGTLRAEPAAPPAPKENKLKATAAR